MRPPADARQSDSAVPPILRPQTDWHTLFFYRKALVLHRLTVVFTRRFLPAHGDRTVDQMVQAARSGKQNIVEGFAAGVTSTGTELKLLNVARASLEELREDYGDFLETRGLPVWNASHPRYDALLRFCRGHNDVEDYEPLFGKSSAEELANLALTLCHMADRMMSTFLKKRERAFTEEGGIRERMTAARLARRRSQAEEMAALATENVALKAEVERLRAELARRPLAGSTPKP